MTLQICTQEQMDIALIKNTQEIIRTISNLEIDLKNQISDFKQEVKNELKRQFHTLLTLIIGIYGIIGASAIAKIFGVL